MKKELRGWKAIKDHLIMCRETIIKYDFPVFPVCFTLRRIPIPVLFKPWLHEKKNRLGHVIKLRHLTCTMQCEDRLHEG